MKRFLLLIMAAVMLFSSVFPCVTVDYSEVFAQSKGSYKNTDESDRINGLIQGIIDWRMDFFNAENGEMFNDNLLQSAGTTAGDWLPFTLGRYTYQGENGYEYIHEDNYTAYIATVTNFVKARYERPEKLDKAKASEWHRISLALAALGANPTDVDGINLIADGTYNRGLTASPGRQGINGWIWGLITMDSMAYFVPEDAYHTRHDFIREIMRAQLADGGFALTGSKADPDMTAMALQALAPYYNGTTVYSYKSSKIKDDEGNYVELNKTVRTVVNEALVCLSRLQNGDGDFDSWGMLNCESTAQVIIALCSLGINPLEDERFIKNGKTLLDGLEKYRLENGGFIHSFVYDEENPTSKPDEANSMASDQALQALVALYRLQNSMRALFDLRPEMTAEEVNSITDLDGLIEELSNKGAENVTVNEVQMVVEKYAELDFFNRRYLKNFGNLLILAEKFSIQIPDGSGGFSGNNTGNTEDVLLYFSQADRNEAERFSELDALTTKDAYKVNELLYRLRNSEDFDGIDYYREILETAEAKIEAIQSEIDAINGEIQENLYPFDSIGFDKRLLVEELVERYEALSEYDRTKIVHYEALLKAHTLFCNIKTAMIIASVCVVIATGAAAFIVVRMRKRKRLKSEKQMEESEE